MRKHTRSFKHPYRTCALRSLLMTIRYHCMTSTGNHFKSTPFQQCLLRRVTDEEGTALVKLAEDAASNKKVRFNSVVVVIAGCRLSFLLQ
ncbi:hypothetical protein P8452_12941 [Trifolium repens]|nr:hypothetical protein P8452_12941 [Trifolium repens]